MNQENLKKNNEDIEFDFAPWSAEKIKEIVLKKGYLLFVDEDSEGLDAKNLSKTLKDAGIERYEGFQNLLYDPNRIDVQTVDVYKGLDKKYKEEGWQELTRIAGGNYAILIKEK